LKQKLVKENAEMGGKGKVGEKTDLNPTSRRGKGKKKGIKRKTGQGSKGNHKATQSDGPQNGHGS